jgi:putative transposase
MPRTARASQANYCYHVLNRGNARAQVFHKPGDYASFVELIEAACRRRPMRVLGYCLMPNHFHLVLWPIGDGDLGTWMQWLMTSHVRRYHRHYHSSGHVWQGRFKAFPIEEDDHLRVVLRYVERNPLRAGLVERAEDWPWSSLRPASSAAPTRLDPGPAPRGEGWVEEVNKVADDGELERLRRSVDRGAPFGSEAWATRTADVLGLESSIRAKGRPRKASPEG